MIDKYNIAGDEHARDVIDRLMSDEKTLIGDPDWVLNPISGDYRLKFPVAVDGQRTGAELIVDTDVFTGFNGFTITFVFKVCLYRLEYCPTGKGHTNPLNNMADYDSIVRGPHYHSWEDNKNGAKSSSLPKTLEIARKLDPSIKNHESALRWMCGELNIQILNNQVTALPRLETLL